MRQAVVLKPRSKIVVNSLKLYLTIVFPVLLVLVYVRLVMSPAFLYFEYTRPGFPSDSYGLTTEQRLQYAPYALDYLLNGEGIDFLGDLKFSDGSSLFNTRELRHMRDVKTVTQISFGLAAAATGLAVAAALALARRAGTRPDLYDALFRGAVLTLGLIVAIVIVAVLSWDFFFVAFHSLFFENDTWYFAYSDTLIRLFPEQFWFDAALLVGGLTGLTALIVLFVTWRLRQNTWFSRQL